MLRGSQTPGELRSRAERYVHFPDTAAVLASLSHLREHRPPLVKNHGRGPGQSQDRWGHSLGPDPERLRPRVRQSGSAPAPEAQDGLQDGLRDELEALRQEVARLRAQLERLLEHAGLSGPEGEP
jgi:uncharacterized protein YceH (UPF0502 family)